LLTYAHVCAHWQAAAAEKERLAKLKAQQQLELKREAEEKKRQVSSKL
jgi:hypothetical protein